MFCGLVGKLVLRGEKAPEPGPAAAGGVSHEIALAGGHEVRSPWRGRVHSGAGSSSRVCAAESHPATPELCLSSPLRRALDLTSDLGPVLVWAQFGDGATTLTAEDTGSSSVGRPHPGVTKVPRDTAGGGRRGGRLGLGPTTVTRVTTRSDSPAAVLPETQRHPL